jgi:tetratricopeptide (TPR) repeat protein
MIFCELIAWLFASECWLANPSISADSRAYQYREIGLTYREQGRFPEAIAAFKTAVKLDASNLSGRVGLGWTQHLARQEEPATVSLLHTVYRDPFHVPALNALGIVLLTRGYLDDAVMVHSWALSVKPDNEVAYYNLSLSYYRLQQYNWAISTAQQAAKLEPSNPHPLVALAISYEAGGDRQSALKACKEAVQLDSRYSDISFSDQLREAGFSSDQIQAAKQIFKQIF